jgi:hypothetical protein
VIVSQPSETVTEITDFTNDWIPYRSMKETNAPLLIVTRPDKLADHTKLYCYKTRGCKIYLVITDTFHRVSRTGERMGEVLFYWADIAETPDSIIANAIEVMIDSAGYEIVLMDSRVPHIPKWGWKADSPYYLYTYNFLDESYPNCQLELPTVNTSAYWLISNKFTQHSTVKSPVPKFSGVCELGKTK